VHLNQLKAELRQLVVQRIDTSIHLKNELAHRFYERHGFRPLNESRLACVLCVGTIAMHGWGTAMLGQSNFDILVVRK